MNRVGIFGGTFDPIHQGHLRAAEEAAEGLDLERVVFVPNAVPPHKTGTQGVTAPFEQRLAWVAKAIAGNPRFEVDALEGERCGPSYSVETVRALRERAGSGNPPVFLIGQDAFADLGIWREPEALLELAHLGVITRPPDLVRSLDECMPGCAKDAYRLAADGRSGKHRNGDTWIRLLAITALDISASELRARLHEGRSVRYLLPEAVWRDVVESGVYAARDTATEET